MRLELTAFFEKVPLGYIAYVAELPGTNTQGRGLDEARANLLESVELVLETNRALAENGIGTKLVIKERFAVLTA